MPKPKLSKAAEQLRKEVNLKYPKRDKRSDGWLGDAAHAKGKSDHNPDKDGWVRAIDIDADLIKGSTKESWLLAEQLRSIAEKDVRFSYIIHKGRIASRKSKWAWRVYKGSNPHECHIHVSFNPVGDLNAKGYKI